MTATRTRGRTGPLALYLDDVVMLRKTHPCGSDTWRVVRLGADIGVVCAGCGRRVLIDRAAFERDIKRFVTRGPLAPAD